MIERVARVVALAVLAGFAATGCRGCLRENVVYEHTINKPDCGMRSVPCPRQYPEFELPPGGPHLVTPAHAGGPGSQSYK